VCRTNGKDDVKRSNRIKAEEDSRLEREVRQVAPLLLRLCPTDRERVAVNACYGPAWPPTGNFKTPSAVATTGIEQPDAISVEPGEPRPDCVPLLIEVQVRERARPLIQCPRFRRAKDQWPPASRASSSVAAAAARAAGRFVSAACCATHCRYIARFSGNR